VNGENKGSDEDRVYLIDRGTVIPGASGILDPNDPAFDGQYITDPTDPLFIIGQFDVGDSVRGDLNITTLNSGSANVGGTTGNNELSGVFQSLITGKTDQGGGFFSFTLGPDFRFEADLGGGQTFVGFAPGTGAMIVLFEDVSVDYTGDYDDPPPSTAPPADPISQLFPGTTTPGIVDDGTGGLTDVFGRFDRNTGTPAPPSAADVSVGPYDSEEAFIATASNGVHWGTFGFLGLPGEGAIGSSILPGFASVLAAFTVSSGTTGASFNFAFNLIALGPAAGGFQINRVTPSPFGGTVDLAASQELRGVFDLDTPFETSSNTNFSFDATVGCIELVKEVSPDGVNWFDANAPDCSDAPGTADPALYRLTISNCGVEELTNCVINDPVLGITNESVTCPPLVGPPVVLTSVDIPELANPDLCPLDPLDPDVVNGGLRNIARVDGEGAITGSPVFDEDPACIKCVCIELIKEVSPDGVTWFDANAPDCSDAPTTADPALYRLTIGNCGSEELTNCVINDPVLGISNEPVPCPTLGGPPVVLDSGDIPELANPDLCPLDPLDPDVVNGGLRNIARVDGEGATSGAPVFDEDPACIKCGPCIELIKEVAGDDGVFKDANAANCSDAATTVVGAEYRLTVCNCGGEPLTDFVLNDPVLGIINVSVPGTLQPGDCATLDSGDIPELSDPDLCPINPNDPNVVNGGLRNIARVDANGVNSGDPVFDIDPACVRCQPQQVPAMTGWGIGVLALGLLGSALRVIRKRNGIQS
jgi:hypothetical protein